MTDVTLRERADIVEVLESDAFVPPPAPQPERRPVLALREAMARFSGWETHAPRRAAVTALIELVDVQRARDLAARLTDRRLGTPEVDVLARLATVVPTETLLGLLGIECDLDAALADVERVVEVVGRGAPASDAADEATERLLALAEHDHRDPVATVSILYQSFDATAALLATTLHASSTGDRAVPAVPRTRRVASRSTTLGDRVVDAGTHVTLEIGQADLQFGAGRHRCPGEQLARAIVDGMIGSIRSRGYTVDPASIATDADGRPTMLVLRRATISSSAG